MMGSHVHKIVTGYSLASVPLELAILNLWVETPFANLQENLHFDL